MTSFNFQYQLAKLPGVARGNKKGKIGGLKKKLYFLAPGYPIPGFPQKYKAKPVQHLASYS